MRGKLIVIEGTDCSGKETQSKKIIENMKDYKFKYFSFPNYDSPTGKIVGGPYLGKSYICDGWFQEGANQVDPKVVSLYYAADRKYNISLINQMLDEGYNVILDRYVYSNMAHQGGKITSKEKRLEMYKWLETLEFDLLELPVPDIKIFLYVPLNVSLEIRKNREESFDQHESDLDHLKHAENAYLEISKLYDFKQIDCTLNDQMLSREEINKIIRDYLISEFNKKVLIK